MPIDPFTPPELLADAQSSLLPVDSAQDWKAYAALLRSSESVLTRLMAETDGALTLSEHCVGLASGALDSAARSLGDLRSGIAAASSQSALSSSVPTTGGQYTRLITESFGDRAVQDRVGSLGREPVTLSAAVAGRSACPSRSPLEVDRSTQSLRLRLEGRSTAFSGLPGTPGCRVDRVWGTPVANSGPSGSWFVSVGSRFPLTGEAPLPAWLPSTYSAGGAVRIRVTPQSPAAVTELALTGTGRTRLLSTAAAVSSRLDPLRLDLRPARALNPDVSAWTVAPTVPGVTSSLTPVRAPGRTPASSDRALAITGGAFCTVSLPASSDGSYGSGFLALRYRAFCPYGAPGGLTALAGPFPAATWVRVLFYAASSPNAFTDSPLSEETFRDTYSHSGGYDGDTSFVHLAAKPTGAQSVVVLVGTDPTCGPTSPAIAYADVWLCDEVLFRSNDIELPGEGQTPFYADLGNQDGLAAITDVWLVLGQATTSLQPAPPVYPVAPGERRSLPLSPLPYEGADPLALRPQEFETYPSPEAESGLRESPSRRTVLGPEPKRWRALSAFTRGLFASGKSRASVRPEALKARRSTPLDTATDSGSNYVYTCGLALLVLGRREFAPSGLYMTLPIGEIDGGISGEIREVGVVTDPPLPELGGRVRIWVVPDSETLVGTGRDSPTNLLGRAVPLDPARPRATFHSTVEALAGVQPADSPIAAGWESVLGATSRPAFSIPPSRGFETSLGVNPDLGVSPLAHVPYVNREAVRHVDAALSSGAALITGAYDPNALRPLAEPLSGGTFAIEGYRPVILTLTLPNGRVIPPDALGPPRPGEIVFSGKEILQEAADVESQHLPADPNVYAVSLLTDPALSSSSRLAFRRSFLTAHSPIASGAQGASLTLWWHKSKDFDASLGGIQAAYDVPIPASDYDVDVHTGQIRLYAQPPGSWADYDQVVAEYFWRVGDLAPREVFPTPSLDALYTPFVPYLVGGATSGTVQVVYKPTQALLQGYTDTATLLSDPTFRHHDEYWTAFHHNNDNIWDNAGRGSSFAPHIPSPWEYWFADNSGEGVQQKIAYPGPGGGNLSLWFAYNADNHSDNWTNRTLNILLEVIQGSQVLETYTLHTHPTQRGTPGLPCLAGSETDASNMTVSPPAWFPAAAAGQWPAFRAGLKSGSNQTLYQFPSGRMVTGSGGLVVSAMEDASSGGVVDNVNTFAVVPGTRPDAPYAVRIPFTTPSAPGLQLRVTTTLLNGNNDGQGIMGFQTDVWWTTPKYTQGCVAPYTYDAITDQCVFRPVSASGSVTDGSGAGATKPIPSDLADLLAGSLQQSYPVTRNVTDYTGAGQGPLRRVNMDPLSPNYYPVFEYRIDPGGIVHHANDLSDVGPYQGTTLSWEYDYLDISPRFIIEILPEGQTVYDLPGSTTGPPGTSTSSPELTALHLVVNARS